ncbi:MAG: hypothetical protein MUQ42_03690, partial [OM182 bacterium]|nr:hypothetical protein [OM182 bacterium]
LDDRTLCRLLSSIFSAAPSLAQEKPRRRDIRQRNNSLFAIKKTLPLASIAPSEVYTWQGKKLSALRYFLQTPKFER